MKQPCLAFFILFYFLLSPKDKISKNYIFIIKHTFKVTMNLSLKEGFGVFLHIKLYTKDIHSQIRCSTA